jgi:methylmalonyl-CoA mutase N-terminal domain/subunit
VVGGCDSMHVGAFDEPIHDRMNFRGVLPATRTLF